MVVDLVSSDRGDTDDVCRAPRCQRTEPSIAVFARCRSSGQRGGMNGRRTIGEMGAVFGLVVIVALVAAVSWGQNPGPPLIAWALSSAVPLLGLIPRFGDVQIDSSAAAVPAGVLYWETSEHQLSRIAGTCASSSCSVSGW